jgi:class 3 adenylate cyclase
MADERDSSRTLEFERKLATILSADVAGYSRLMAEDEEQTLRIFRGHKEVFEALVVAHRGRIFNTAGDAILAEFGSAVEAVRCATEIQAALRTRNDHLPESHQVKFRIGVNLGDVLVQGVDLLGDGVNVAARLQSAAEPGGVCISGSVYDQIRNKLSLSFRSLGEQSYKNIPQPVRTYSIAEAESEGAPPTRRSHRSGSGGPARWAAAAVLLLAVGGGTWGYTQYRHGQAEDARIRAETDRIGAADATHRAIDGTAKNEVGAGLTIDPIPRPTSLAPAASRGGGSLDGSYSGPMCYGAVPNNPARCFRTQATVSEGKISGQWSSGRNPGVTMILAGEVSGAGDVTIEIHAESPTTPRGVEINLSGTLRDGRLDASGSFRSGREASLNWRRD